MMRQAFRRNAGFISIRRTTFPFFRRVQTGSKQEKGQLFVKVKVKVTLEQTMKAQWGSRDIALLFL